MTRRERRGRVRVQRELRGLIDSVLTEQAGYDRATAEGLVRVLTLVAQLHAEHLPDERGRCPSCGRWRRCPVQGAFKRHLAPWTEEALAPPGESAPPLTETSGAAGTAEPPARPVPRPAPPPTPPSLRRAAS